MKEKELVTVKTYAEKNGVTAQCVYKWIDKKEVKCVIIDGVKFIEV